MYRLKVALAIAAQGLVVCNAVAKNHKDTRPNFIIINCDDMGYGDLSCFGSPTIKTPNLDRMAQEGQKWSSFYVSSPVSSPSRAGLLTGRTGVRTGMYGNRREVLFPDSPGGLPDGEITIAELLRQAGYRTGCIGKWHLGDLPEYMPLRHGFDYFYGYPYSNDMSKRERGGNYPFEYTLYEQDEVIEVEPDQHGLTQQVTNAAVRFIESKGKQPFFLYVAHPMPHWPVYASSDFENTSARGKYGDTIEELDWSAGRILEALKEKGLDKNTLVIFTSDNGPWLTYRQLGGSSGPLREGKNSSFDGGFRVPCIMWGAMVKPGQITDMGSTLDLLPTFCEMAGVDVPADREYDGVSLVNVIKEKSSSKREVFYFYKGSEMYAIRKGNYKLHFCYKPAYAPGKKVVYENPELYDLGTDPSELYNIAEKHPEVVKELTELANAYKDSFTVAESIFDLPVRK